MIRSLLLTLALLLALTPAAHAARGYFTEADDLLNPSSEEVAREANSHPVLEDPDTGGPTPTGVPIDGGGGWLALAGAGWGARRLRRVARSATIPPPAPEC